MDERKITLSDLKSNNLANMKVVSPTDILPAKEKENPQQEFIDDIFGSMDAAIERKMSDVAKKLDEAEEFANQVVERQELEKELSDEYDDVNDSVIINDRLDKDDKEDYSLSSVYDNKNTKRIELVKKEEGIDLSDFAPQAPMTPIIKEVVEKMEEKREEVIARPVVEELKVKANIAPIQQIPANVENITFISDEDLLSELDEEDKKRDDSDQMDAIKSKIKEKIRPVTNAIDLSTFTVSRTAISVNNALKVQSNTNPVHVVDWMLYNSEMPISMREFTGYEIEKLNPSNGGRNRFNTYKDVYELIFSHVVDTNKPETLEAWLKLTNFYDTDHLYFAIYKACFDKANYIPYSCPHCKNVFVTDDIKVDDMVKYRDAEAKAKAHEIMSKVGGYTSHEFDVELVQISDNYVLGFKVPTIYNIVFENAILDEKFTNKYADLLSIISYIDSIYVIDYKTSELRPISLDFFENNMAKTIKSKIIKFSKLLQGLNSDQLQLISAMINSIAEKNNAITYVLPEVTCPECKENIKETPMSAENLVFTRHQLAGIASI